MMARKNLEKKEDDGHVALSINAEPDEGGLHNRSPVPVESPEQKLEREILKDIAVERRLERDYDRIEAGEDEHHHHHSTPSSGKDGKEGDDEDNDDEDDEDEEKPTSCQAKIKIALHSMIMMFGGALLVSFFSDPMVDVIDDFGVTLGVPPFYVSFIVTPFCSNASELISSLVFAARKKRKNTSMT